MAFLNESGLKKVFERVKSKITSVSETLVKRSEMGTANGVATLGSDGKVPSAQLPSYVDDVLEFTSKSNFPASGESGKIYVATDTNLTYRWSGTAYVEISQSLALGETSSTAYAGDKGAALKTKVDTLEGKVNGINYETGMADVVGSAYGWTGNAPDGSNIVLKVSDDGSDEIGDDNVLMYVPVATTNNAGVMTAEDKQKLDALVALSDEQVASIADQYLN